MSSAALPAVTVVVVSFRHAEYLPTLLASIEAQLHAPAHVILCDDASDDASPALLNKWARETSLNTTVVANPVNRGLTATLNEAVALVDTPWFCYISGDDVMRPDRLSRQLSVVSDDLGFIYSDATVIDELDNVVDESFFSAHIGQRDHIEDSYADLLRFGNWIPACSVLVRTSALRAVGGYDASLFFEDYDLWLRLARLFPFTHLTQPLVSFRVLGSSLGSRRFKDDDVDWHWTKVRIRAKQFGASAATDRLIAITINSWLITLAARGFDRRLLAPIFRRSARANPTLRSVAWAVVSAMPAEKPVRLFARRSGGQR